MIRIITIHHNTFKFLPLQKKYIEKHVSEEYVVYCGYAGIKIPIIDEYNKYKMFDITNIGNSHSNRLNHLLKIVYTESDDSDILIIMDSDTLIINDNVINIVKKYLTKRPIVAILRSENFYYESFENVKNFVPEFHPHPAFFVTRIKFLKSNNLWFNDSRHPTGYNIYMWLKEKSLKFRKLKRSNKINIHPLNFGIYGDLVYHHGSGSQEYPYDSVDICNRLGLDGGVSLDILNPKIVQFNKKLSDLVLEEIVENDEFIKNYFLGIYDFTKK